MTGPEHVREAEQLLRWAREIDREQSGDVADFNPVAEQRIAALGARAQAHATLAGVLLMAQVGADVAADPGWDQLTKLVDEAIVGKSPE